MNPLEGITLDRLFRPQKSIDILGQSITVRALSDPERNERYRKAMLARVRLSQKLSDKASDEYAVNFGTLPEATDAQMREAIMLFRARGAAIRAEREIPYPFIPVPDNAEVGEIETTLAEREKVVNETNLARAKMVASIVEEAEKGLSTKTRDELESQYIQAVRERVLDLAYGEESVALTIHFATDKHFSVEDVRGMHGTIRDTLWSAAMEVDNIDPLRLSGPALTGSSPERTI